MRLRKRIRSIMFLLLIPFVLGLAWWFLYPNTQGASSNVDERTLDVQTNVQPEPSLLRKGITIDIEGAVQKAGVLNLPPQSRVADAIAAAGGLTTEGSTQHLNLAQKLEDGAQIRVPLKSEGVNRSELDSSDLQKDKVSINTATEEELSKVQGISKTKAREIVNYRIKQGPYLKIEDLMKVKGISQKLVRQIEPQVSLN